MKFYKPYEKMYSFDIYFIAYHVSVINCYSAAWCTAVLPFSSP